MSQEQSNIDELVTKLIEAKYPTEDIIDILSSIIKQQMLMGGNLDDKIKFHLSSIKNY